MGKSKHEPLWATRQLGFLSLFKKENIFWKTSISNLVWCCNISMFKFDISAALECRDLQGFRHKFNLLVTRGRNFPWLLQSMNWFLSMLQKCNSVIFAGESFRRPVVSKSKNTSVLIINGTVEYLEDILTTNKRWRRRYFNETFWGFMTYKKVLLGSHLKPPTASAIWRKNVWFSG